MIADSAWINLPVGYNLNDHVGVSWDGPLKLNLHSSWPSGCGLITHLTYYLQTDIEISHPSVVTYDFYGAWDKPITSDTDLYLSKWIILGISEAPAQLTSRFQYRKPDGNSHPVGAQSWPHLLGDGQGN